MASGPYWEEKKTSVVEYLWKTILKNAAIPMDDHDTTHRAAVDQVNSKVGNRIFFHAFMSLLEGQSLEMDACMYHGLRWRF